jgi:hypothetical protein
MRSRLAIATDFDKSWDDEKEGEENHRVHNAIIERWKKSLA